MIQSSPGRARTLAVNALALLFGKAAAVAIGLASLALLTRHLGPSGFGEYRTVLTFMTFAVILADLGLRTVVLRELSKPGSDGSSLVGNGLALRIVATSSVALGGAMLGLAMPYSEVVQLGLLIGAAYYVLLQASMFFWAVFMRHLKQGQLMLAEALGGLVMLAGVVAGIRLDGGVLWMLGALTAGGVAQFLLSWLLARRLTPFRPRFDVVVWRDLIRIGSALAGSEIALMLILRGDVLVLTLLDTPSSVGLYSVPSKIFEILASVAALFCGMMMPFFVAAVASGNDVERSVSLRNSLDVMLIYGLAIVACSFALAPGILTLIAGAEFVQAALALMLVSIAIASNALSQPYRQMLTAIDRQRSAFRVDLICVGLALIAYVTLIPAYSIVGAGLATAIVETGLLVLLAVSLRRRGVSGLLPASIIKAPIACLAAVVSMRVLADDLVHWSVALLIGMLVYCIVLLVLKAIPMSFVRAMIRGDGDSSTREPG